MPAPHPFRRRVRLDGVYVCGDHRDTSSIQGAMVSGRRPPRRCSPTSARSAKRAASRPQALPAIVVPSARPHRTGPDRRGEGEHSVRTEPGRAARDRDRAPASSEGGAPRARPWPLTAPGPGGLCSRRPARRDLLNRQAGTSATTGGRPGRRHARAQAWSRPRKARVGTRQHACSRAAVSPDGVYVVHSGGPDWSLPGFGRGLP